MNIPPNQHQGEKEEVPEVTNSPTLPELREIRNCTIPERSSKLSSDYAE